jgi:hypothetical protein
MVAGGSRHGAKASSSRAAPWLERSSDGAEGGREYVDAPSSLFADAQEEQQLWEELRGHDASLNQALNEALQIHGGPAWRIFQVRRCSCIVPPDCCFLLRSCHFCVYLRGAALMDFVY